jgi:hypothetical protein
MDSYDRPDSDVANFDHQLFDLARWDFREFAAFLRRVDPAFIESGSMADFPLRGTRESKSDGTSL